MKIWKLWGFTCYSKAMRWVLNRCQLAVAHLISLPARLFKYGKAEAILRSSKSTAAIKWTVKFVWATRVCEALPYVSSPQAMTMQWLTMQLTGFIDTWEQVTHHEVWTRCLLRSLSNTCRYITIICKKRIWEWLEGGFGHNNPQIECSQTHFVGVLYMDTKSQFLQDPSFSFNDLVLQVHIVLIQHHWRWLPAEEEIQHFSPQFSNRRE